MDLVRQILIALEKHEHGFAPPDFTIAGYDQEVIRHHVWLMEQGHLLTAIPTTGYSNGSPSASPLAITWTGHDFLAAVGNESVWSKVKTLAKDRMVTLPFTLLQALAVQILAGHIGLPPHQ